MLSGITLILMRFQCKLCPQAFFRNTQIGNHLAEDHGIGETPGIIESMTTETEDWFAKMIANPEELDPELADCIVEYGDFQAIKHPLVNDGVYMAVMNPKYNAQLRMKREHIADAKKKRDWGQVVFLHEKPWRIEALLEIADDISDAEYWKLVREVWMNSENIHEWDDNIEEALHSPRSRRELLMDEEDRSLYDALDGTVTIYRGHQDENQYGWSWTLDEMKALWFARRYGADNPLLTEGVVAKLDIIAVLRGMGESEVIVDPAQVEMVSTTQVMRISNG